MQDVIFWHFLAVLVALGAMAAGWFLAAAVYKSVLVRQQALIDQLMADKRALENRLAGLLQRNGAPDNDPKRSVGPSVSLHPAAIRERQAKCQDDTTAAADAEDLVCIARGMKP